MPELPEVETIRRGLETKILNKKIKSIDVIDKRIVKSDLEEFNEILLGNKLKEINRTGKLLHFDLHTDQDFLLVHLKMTGQLIYRDNKELVAGGHKLRDQDVQVPNKATSIILDFADKSKLYFNCQRKFGYWKLVDQEELEDKLNKFGIEPFDNKFTLQYFTNLLGSRQTKIKPFLLDQSKIAGIGNIYADEACFFAKINPERRINTLKPAEIKLLHQGIKEVMDKAIKAGGTTFRSFRNDDGKVGNFTEYLKVYGRSGEKCLRCGQGTIHKIKLGGRGTSYCNKCQH